MEEKTRYDRIIRKAKNSHIGVFFMIASIVLPGASALITHSEKIMASIGSGSSFVSNAASVRPAFVNSEHKAKPKQKLTKCITGLKITVENTDSVQLENVWISVKDKIKGKLISNDNISF